MFGDRLPVVQSAAEWRRLQLFTEAIPCKETDSNDNTNTITTKITNPIPSLPSDEVMRRMIADNLVESSHHHLHAPAFVRSSNTPYLSNKWEVSPEISLLRRERNATDSFQSRVLHHHQGSGGAATLRARMPSSPKSRNGLVAVYKSHPNTLQGVISARLGLVEYDGDDTTSVHPQFFTQNMPPPVSNHGPSRFPFRKLLMKGLMNDFYLHTLAWSRCNDDILAIAMKNSIYVTSALDASSRCSLKETPTLKFTSVTNELGADVGALMVHRKPSTCFVASISWSCKGALASCTGEGEVDIVDITRGIETMTYPSYPHNGNVRLSCCAFHPTDDPRLCTGGKDANIRFYDTRINGITNTVAAHRSEVCGLEWSPDGSLLATGGTDQKLRVWDSRNFSVPLMNMERHKAAVRAITWCRDHPSLLASGGGLADRLLTITDLSTCSVINSMDVHSQVCSLLWSNIDSGIILAALGFPEKKIGVFGVDRDLHRIDTLESHDGRVLNLVSGRDGRYFASGGSDQRVCLWRLF